MNSKKVKKLELDKIEQLMKMFSKFSFVQLKKLEKIGDDMVELQK